MRQTDMDEVCAIENLSHRAPWSREILSDCVLVGYDCRVLEIEDKKKKQLIGYVICRQNFAVCHILNLCVSPDYQSKGYGSLLLKTILDSVKSQHLISSVILEVRPSNTAALALYEKFGFHKDTIKKDYYTDKDGKLEDAVLLKKAMS